MVFHQVVEKLASKYNTEVLSLENTQLTDVGFLEFAKRVRLRELTITGTQVTDTGVAEFKKKNRRCHVKK